MNPVYLVDIGILLNKGDKEFESYNYVYDKKYGYYDENQFYVPSLEEAREAVEEYVKEGVNETYGVISKTALSDMTDSQIRDAYVEGETYSIDNVVYSIAKLDGEIIENFVEK